MKYVIVAALLNLLSKLIRSQRSPEVNLVNRLNDFYHFDHNIFLLDSVYDRNRYVPVGDKSAGHITPQTIYIFDRNNVNTVRRTVNTKNPFLIVVTADGFEFQNGTQLLDEMMAIRKLKPRIKIGIFFQNSISSMGTVSDLFKWSWKKQIVDIFCAFYTNADGTTVSSQSFNQFRFDPFGASFLRNLTGSEFLQNYFPGTFPNYHQQPLRLWSLYDIEYSEYGLTFWHNVARIFNASVTIAYTGVYEYEYFGFDSVKADVAVFVSNQLNNTLIRLYPQRSQRLMLLVPHAQPYSDFVAYLNSSKWNTLFAYAFVVIATASILLSVSGYLHAGKRKSFFQCVADVVNLIINDNTAIKYGRLHRADVYIIVPLTFVGLIVANGILSVFKSYLTVPNYERQIKTIDDLYKSHTRILAHDVYWTNETIGKLENLTRLSGWRERVQPISFLQQLDELYKFNNSVAYSLVPKYWRLAITVQKRLNFKAYYLITETFLAQYFVTFPINPAYPFIEPIDWIYHRVQSSGIGDKWLRDIDEKEIKPIMKDARSRQLKSNNDGSGGSPFTVVWCGWVAGVVAFIGELFFAKFSPKFLYLSTGWSRVLGRHAEL